MAEMSEDEENRELREMNDPEFFAHWAAIRNRLIVTPTGSSKHSEAKRRYDAVTAEYRRRIGGEMGLTTAEN